MNTPQDDKPTQETPIRVKTVSVTFERKHNMGNYESATFACTMWADLREDADLATAMNQLWTAVKENVRVQGYPLTKLGKSPEQSYLGLPMDAPKPPVVEPDDSGYTYEDIPQM